MGKGQRRSTTVERDEPLTQHQQAMKRLSDAEARQHAADDWGRRNRRKHPLDALCTAPLAERYATHERAFFTETPDGKPLVRPLYPTESEGFLRQLDDAKGEYRVPKRNYLEVKDVAELLDTSADLVRDIISRGELKSFSPGTFKRVTLAELKAYLEKKGYSVEQIAEIEAQWLAKVTVPA